MGDGGAGGCGPADERGDRTLRDDARPCGHPQRAPGRRPDLLLGQLPALSGDLSCATVYYPWLTVSALTGTEQAVPPCGHIAGIWARTDRERGVFKAPANTPVLDVVGPAYALDDDQQGALNAEDVNCIRNFPGQDTLVWGARTQAPRHLDPDRCYINVQRLVCCLYGSIQHSTRWVAFEPNDERLRAALRDSITSFLRNQW